MNWWLVPFAIGAGILSGMGMGGGTVLIPVLTLVFGWEQHLAQWLNLVAFVPSAVVALIIHMRNRLLDAKTWGIMLVPSLISAIGFSFLAVKVKGRILSLIFGVFLALVGAVNLVLVIRGIVRERKRNTPREPADI